ncbi:hypothetical protein BAQ45_11585 [Bacillus pacificus]|uniref:hypothetical protein n=1 Tax=Bacillus pacificus TaxID=2026187 RepID=UPI00080761D0|nr:hypothetical protein [Bacillus pacificus]OBZ60099.1 hypothetical protein UN66_05320 [Bacillus cereus]OJE24544.1 hypothetical protein BAQ45_11585 [Bacillus pacificus]
MKTIEIHTQGGLKHKVQTEVYDAQALNEQLNSNDLITVLIGDFIIQRIDVKRIIPLTTVDAEGTKKVEVHTNGGKVIEITTNDYDPIFLNEQLNNSNTITVVIGDYIFSRIDVKQIVPVKEEPIVPPTTEEPPEETDKQTEPTEQL